MSILNDHSAPPPPDEKPEGAEDLQTTPPQAPPDGSVENEQTTPQPVTLEQVKQLLDARDGTLVEQVSKRLKRSVADQINNRLRQYDETVKLQEKAGKPIPPEDQEAARSLIRQEGLTATDDEEEAAPPPDGKKKAADPKEQYTTFVLQQTGETFKDVGFEVKPGMPEWKSIEDALRDPNFNLARYLGIVRRAAETAKDRTASDAENADARTLGAGPRGAQRNTKKATPEDKVSEGLSNF